MGNMTPSIDNAEHIGPDTTGDNIAAKKVATYGWDGANWQRQSPNKSGLVTEAHDYIEYTNTSTTVDTYTFKSGGSTGTTVATLTITYVDSTKNQVLTLEKT